MSKGGYDPDIGVVPTVATLRRIIKDRQYRTLEWSDGVIMIVDMNTANAMLLVYDAFQKAESREKFEYLMAKSRQGFETVAEFAWTKMMHREARS